MMAFLRKILKGFRPQPKVAAPWLPWFNDPEPPSGRGRIRARNMPKRQAILDLLRRGAEREQKAERVLASFRDHLARLLSGEVREIPGAADVFGWLRGRGIRVALNTGFDLDSANMLLEALGWEHAHRGCHRVRRRRGARPTGAGHDSSLHD